MDRITYLDSYRYKENIYFSCAEFNGLYKKNIISGAVDFLNLFPDGSNNAKMIHRKIYGRNNRVFFFPFYGQAISVYDIDEERIEYIDINRKTISAIIDAHVVDNKCFIISANSDCGIKHLDINNLQIEQFKIFENEKFDIDFYGSVLVKDKIFIGARGTNRLYIYGVFDKSIERVDLSEDIKIRNINYIDNKIWITVIDSMQVFRMNLDSFEEEKVSVDSNNDKGMLLRIEKWNNKIVALPGTNSKMYIFNADSNCFEDVDCIISRENPRDIMWYFIDDVITLVRADLLNKSNFLARDAINIPSSLEVFHEERASTENSISRKKRHESLLKRLDCNCKLGVVNEGRNGNTLQDYLEIICKS